MKNKIIYSLMAFFILISIGFANAGIEYMQFTNDYENGILQTHISTFYSKTGFGLTEDYISGGKPFEASFRYDVYVKTWNSGSQGNDLVDYCELIIGKTPRTGGIVTLLDVNYTEAEEDIAGGKYFVSLNNGESAFADIFCHFQNQSYNTFEFPMTLELITPSWECKACQLYEWSVTEAEVEKGKIINNNVVNVSKYIKQLFILNFEIVLALFWIFLILMIFTAISFIFAGCWWAFFYLKKFAK